MTQFQWEHAVFEYSLSTAKDPLIRVYTTSEGLVSEEVRRTGTVAVICFRDLIWLFRNQGDAINGSQFRCDSHLHSDHLVEGN